MTNDEIIAALGAAKSWPAEAVSAGIARAEALAPAILAVVNEAADGAYLVPRQQRLLVRGVHILAAARHKPLWPPMLRLLRRDYTDLERVFGDLLTETIPRALLSIYDGDVAALMAAIEDPAMDGIVRWPLLDVLSFETFHGRVPRETTHALLVRCDRADFAPPGDGVWVGWQEAVAQLGFEDLAGRVRASWDDGRNPQAPADRAEWEATLQRSRADPASDTTFAEVGIKPLDTADDVAAWLARAAALDQEEPAESAPRLKHPDPAEKIELARDEIFWLDGFLETRSTGKITSFERLDGFFSALVAGPETPLPSEYLPVIWGGEGPVYDSMEQAEYVIGLMMRHWNSIAARLSARYPHFPVHRDVSDPNAALPWADGFMQGVNMRFEVWDDHMRQSEPLTGFLGHILVLAVDAKTAALDSGPDAAERPKMIESLPLALLGAAVYWRDEGQRGATRRQPSREPARATKVGRNAPCPCGSGRKFKHCCGDPNAPVGPGGRRLH